MSISASWETPILAKLDSVSIAGIAPIVNRKLFVGTTFRLISDSYLSKNVGSTSNDRDFDDRNSYITLDAGLARRETLLCNIKNFNISRSHESHFRWLFSDVTSGSFLLLRCSNFTFSFIMRRDTDDRNNGKLDGAFKEKRIAHGTRKKKKAVARKRQLKVGVGAVVRLPIAVLRSVSFR